MKFKSIAAGAVAASMTLSPVSPLAGMARADSGDLILGIIGGAIVGAAINEGSKKKSKSTKAKGKSSAPAMSAEQRAENIEVQQSLNYFGWNVGGADGVLGKKSKSAIIEYQAFMGFPATGTLTAEERMILTTAHSRAEAGGAIIQDIVAGSVYGIRGVLLAQRDEMTGPKGSIVASAPKVEESPAPGSIAAKAEAALPSLLPTVTEPAGAIVAAPAAPAPAPIVAPVVAAPAPAPAPVVAPAPEPVEVATAEPTLPSFMAPGGANGALADECTSAMLKVSTKGGYDTAATMTDANTALTEQFCLTRASAISTGQALAAKVAGFSPEQIAQQCAGFAPMLKEQVASLSMRPEADVLASVEAFILQSGMSPAQLSGTAKVCLGVGYEQENMEVAIASALLLTAMGEKPYAELLGHHLSQGFGASERPDLAADWYDVALGAMSTGDIFAPAVAGRADLVKKAAYTAAGRTAELEPEAKVEEAALPSFVVEPAPAPAPAPVAPAPVAPAPAPVIEAVIPAPAIPAPAPAPAPETAVVAPAPVLPAPIAPAAAEETPAPMGVIAPVSAPAPGTGDNAAVMREGAVAVANAARLPFLIISASY